LIISELSYFNFPFFFSHSLFRIQATHLGQRLLDNQFIKDCKEGTQNLIFQNSEESLYYFLREDVSVKSLLSANMKVKIEFQIQRNRNNKTIFEKKKGNAFSPYWT